MKVLKKAFTEGTAWTGEDEDEVEEERSPAKNKDSQQDGERDRPFHARGLAPAFLKRSDASGMYVGQHEHVQVERSVEHQGYAEEGNQAHDYGVVGVVNDEEDAGGDAGEPNQNDDGDGAVRGHDAVVAQRVKDGDVAVCGDGAQEGERGNHGAANHHVDDIVQVAQRAWVHIQEVVVVQEHEYGFNHVADAHQHVGHCQAADEVVHGGVQVAVPDDGQDHQDVLHQADQTQRQEQFLRDPDMDTVKKVALSARGVGFVVVQDFGQRVELRVEIAQGVVADIHV